MKSFLIRQHFIDFFKSKGHTVVSSAPVVPDNDPTLLFTNAGMNQFKPYFLGKEQAPYTSAVNSQPCIRVSGKHNDLEDVGLDTYHHTSFEMLGNWSFGDYYKKDAIIWAWQLLTEVYNLPKAHLLATVFEDDEEAYELWRSCTDIHPDHIVRCGKKDNFWEMGATGPCGPCSELHIDLTPDLGFPVEQDPITKGLTDRYMELWNLVFIQFDRTKDGSLLNLPQKHIDTGAGLERLSALIQGVASNYDTDCFDVLIQAVSNKLGVSYDTGQSGIPHRVISDHIRTVSFAIADNVIPSNDGRGYVLRRLIRRALRFASQAGQKDPFLYTLIPIVNESFHGHYSHIGDRVDFISDLVKSEEEQFLKTVSSGLNLFYQVTTDIKNENKTEIPGHMAFKLYDTYGFPIDLTQVMASEDNLTVNMDEFNLELDKQRKRSRASRQNSLSAGVDESIESNSDILGEVYDGVYVDQPGGGEARIPANQSQRFGIAQHHSATHLLNASLRQVLGDSVQQAGSMVDVNRLRFDFSYGQLISKDQLKEITSIVNNWIYEDHEIQITEEPIVQAKKRGAVAMFGEKYGDVVRVVDIQGVSLELCGGNHLTKTSDCEIFKIISESSIAAGTRRIEAIVGRQRVDEYNLQQINKLYSEYSQKYKRFRDLYSVVNNFDSSMIPNQLSADSSEEHLKKSLNQLTKLIKQLEKQQRLKQQDVAGDLVSIVLDSAVPLKLGDGFAVFKMIENQPVSVLRTLSDRVSQKLSHCIIILVASDSQKTQAVAKVSESLLDVVTAPALIKDFTSVTGGGGGGSSTMAQAGGLILDKVSYGLRHMLDKYAK